MSKEFGINIAEVRVPHTQDLKITVKERYVLFEIFNMSGHKYLNSVEIAVPRESFHRFVEMYMKEVEG